MIGNSSHLRAHTLVAGLLCAVPLAPSPALWYDLGGVAVNLISDMVLSADWKELLMEAIKLLNNIGPQ